MKYVIINSNTSYINIQSEVEARKQYLYDLFNMYFIKISKDADKKAIVLESFPFNNSKYIFIKGENLDVNNYLFQNKKLIKEENIVLITCGIFDYKKIFNNSKKNIYICKLENNLANLYNGFEYGFEFNITQSEIDLYNNKSENIEKNIKTFFTKL